MLPLSCLSFRYRELNLHIFAVSKWTIGYANESCFPRAASQQDLNRVPVAQRSFIHSHRLHGPGGGTSSPNLPLFPSAGCRQEPSEVCIIIVTLLDRRSSSFFLCRMIGTCCIKVFPVAISLPPNILSPKCSRKE